MFLSSQRVFSIKNLEKITICSMAQQGSHVPKFGNWDNDNIPYTAYFENARYRKEKTDGNVMINPNDPEQNPEAFVNMHARYGMESEAVELSFGQPLSQQKHADHSHQRTSIATHKSISSDQSSACTSSDHSLLQAAGYPPQQSRKTSETHPSVDNRHHRAASIPKFGAWDEGDPTSGEGFTVIFSRVKEEKHTASTTLQSRPTQPTYYSNIQRNQTASSPSRYKFCCCPFSCGRK